MLHLRNVVAGVVSMSCIVTGAMAADGVDQVSAPLVDWSHAIAAYRHADEWVRAGSTAQRGEEAIEVAGLAGVRVTLRWGGRTMSFGESTYEGVLDNPLQKSDLLTFTAGAMDRALLGLRSATPGGDQGVEERVAAILPRLTVDLEVALSPEPVVLSTTALQESLYHRFAPGYHGLRLTVDGRQGAAWIWPATALARGQGPEDQIHQALQMLRLSHETIKVVARPSGPRLERFETIHIVKPSWDLPPMRLVRGNTLLPTTVLDGNTLDRMAFRITQHLLRRQRDNGRMAGTYRPTSDRYDPETATAVDHALAVYAMSQWARYSERAQPELARHKPTEAAVAQAVDHLMTQLMPKLDTVRITPAALTLMTLCEAPYLADRKGYRDALATQILALRNDNGTFGSQQPNEVLDSRSQAIIVAALVQYYEQTRDEALLAKVVASYREIWNSGGRDNLAAMPWLARTWTRLRRLGVVDRLVDPNQTTGLVASHMATVVVELLGRQITSAPQLGPEDVIGGFTLTRRTPDGAPHADVRSADGLWLIAEALQSDSFLSDKQVRIDQSRVELIISAGLAARFLAQLMFDEPGCYYVISANDAMGGVRQSLWDNQLPVHASAGTLLATTALLDALQRAEGN